MKQKKLTVWQKVGMFFYLRRSLTALLFIAIASIGLLSYTNLMKREGFPSVTVPIGVVRVLSFNSTPEQVDQQYVGPIIASAQKNQNLKSVQATTGTDGSSIVVTYKDGTDVQSALNTIESDVSSTLPKDGRVVYIKVNSGKLTTEGDDILISVHQKGLTIEELDSSAQKLASLVKAEEHVVGDVHVFPSVEKVTNPATGQTRSQQVRFDRYFDQETGETLPSTIIGITAKPGVDQLDLYDHIEEVLNSEKASTIGADSAISANFAEGIREQISSLQKNLLEGLAVVLVVSFILISLRSSVVTALSMAVTVLATVGILHLIGYTLNTITLFSLVLCLALIVDDTTIMVEAIDAGLKRGGKFKEVVSEAMRKVARASATGTLTTMLAFSPMLFIGGILGKFIRAIPVTILISLLVSLVVSFVFIPLLVRLSYGLKAIYKPRKFKGVDRIETAIGESLARALQWSDITKRRRISMRVGAVVVGTGFLIGGVMIFRQVGFNIFPSPKDSLEITLNASVVDRENASIATTQILADKALAEAELLLGSNLEKVTLTGQGGSGTKDGFSAQLTLTPINSRNTSSVKLSDALQKTLDEKVPGLRTVVAASGVGPPAGNFEVQVKTTDVEKAYQLANDIKSYVDTAVLTRPDGSNAKLTNASVTPKSTVSRQNGDRVVSVTADFEDADTSRLVRLAQEAIEKEFDAKKVESYSLPKDSIQFDFGQEEENQESFKSMGQAAGPLLLAMFIVMALLFRSLIQPLLILTALPFAIFGVASGLFLTNNDISFFSMLGVFALIGISLNNTILLTDYANQAQLEGKRPTEAMAIAIRERLRPLLTTSITSVLALLPLALNDPFWEALAYALIFGLISSTVLVLLVFPYYYLIAESLRGSLSKVLRKFKKA